MITVEPERLYSTAMFLRQQLASGTNKTGKIELAMSGGALIFAFEPKTAKGEPFGTGRIVETISLNQLLVAWADSVLQEQIR
jgi:hypothetical protein